MKRLCVRWRGANCGKKPATNWSRDAELVSLGHYFTSPGFTDEHCYFFLARPVRKTAAGAQHDDTEAIIDCREFSADVLREMIAEGEVRDANTLSIWARLVARGEIFP